VREAAAILAASEAFVGLEGFLGHLARAVDCPAVIVLGGRALPETFGYPGNEYLAAPMPCAPCGLRNRCEHDRGCLTGVGVEAVLGALGRLLARSRDPLPVAKAVV
jgi:heptosyltransferase-1